MERAQAEALIRGRGWLSTVPPEFAVRLLSRARLSRVEPGQALWHAGDEPGSMCGVVAGGAQVHLPLPDGGETLVTILRCGTWFGAGPQVTRRPRTLSFRWHEPGWAFRLPLSAVDALVQDRPDMARPLASVHVQATEVAARVLADTTIRDNLRRVAAVLWRVTDEGDDQTDRAFPLSQAELAVMAAVSRQVVNRSLAAFEAKGWLRAGYGKITFTDRRALFRCAWPDQD